MIKSGDLVNRAADPAGSEEVNAALRKLKARPGPTDELAQLRERIARARHVMAPRGACCGHCVGEGRDAVLRILDGG